jgi:hypothetical protein
MINPKDILEAMQMMEFDDFVPRLEAELASQFPYLSIFHPFNQLTTILPQNSMNLLPRSVQQQKSLQNPRIVLLYQDPVPLSIRPPSPHIMGMIPPQRPRRCV